MEKNHATSNFYAGFFCSQCNLTEMLTLEPIENLNLIFLGVGSCGRYKQNLHTLAFSTMSKIMYT